MKGALRLRSSQNTTQIQVWVVRKKDEVAVAWGHKGPLTNGMCSAFYRSEFSHISTQKGFFSYTVLQNQRGTRYSSYPKGFCRLAELIRHIIKLA